MKNNASKLNWKLPLYGAIGFGIGGAVLLALWLTIENIIVDFIAILIAGAIGGAALGLALNDKKKIIYLACAGATGLFIASIIADFIMTVTEFIITIPIGGAVLGLILAYLTKNEGKITAPEPEQKQIIIEELKEDIKHKKEFTDPPTRDVFISHVEEDYDVASQIANGLEAAGYTTWYYERDSLPGPSYLLQTGQAIDESKSFVLIISPQSLGSQQVTGEVVQAHESGKPFIPVLSNITHVEFQRRQPEWRRAMGASTSINIPKEGVSAIIHRIVGGLKELGIQPGGKA